MPPLRRDLQLVQVEHDGRQLIFFQDPMGYVKKSFALDAATFPLLSLFNGKRSAGDLINHLSHQVGEMELVRFVKMLDQTLLLDSDYFHQSREGEDESFEKKKLRPPLLDSARDHSMMDQLGECLKKASARESRNRIEIKALFAPHIDLSIGLEYYCDAFGAISHLRPERVVILGTSHYAGLYGNTYQGYPFIGSEKSYQIGNRVFSTDSSLLRQLMNHSQENGFTLRDRAHRTEHSIEIHLICLSAIWQHHFTIVPILVGNLDELFYHTSGEAAKKSTFFANQIRELDSPGTFYLISGDLSHTGHKFGDSDTARKLKLKSEKRDHLFMNHAAMGSPDKLLGEVGSDYDSTRICGFPPLYTYLRAVPGLKGKSLNYHWWDEKERESAVSFGSILYG